MLWCTAAALLCVPLVAMIFTNEVNWAPGDFIVMGGLLAALCAAVELAYALRLSRERTFLAIAVSVAVFLMVWVELAVGIFD